MLSQRQGKIVNIASIVGVMGNAGQVNYSASKAGVIGITKTLAKEFASRNIQVNAVAPGFIDTEMTQKLTPQQRETLMNVIPMKRIAKPEEIASVVVFLASPAASYITGQVLNVDGGLVM
jgi:3-oxoacyl-[acyl-carrier protein] reductase